MDCPARSASVTSYKRDEIPPVLGVNNRGYPLILGYVYIGLIAPFIASRGPPCEKHMRVFQVWNLLFQGVPIFR